MSREYQIALLAIGAMWILCALIPRAVRVALRDGLHCMGRYPDLWRIPLAFGIAHGIFQFAKQAVFLTRMGMDAGGWLSAVDVSTLPALSSIARFASMQAAGSTAAIFTTFNATFPLSALCAVAYLANVNGLLGETRRAIVRRFPRTGWWLVALLVLSALAAILHPAVYLLLPEASERLTFYGVAAISLFAIIFEFLLGIFFLTCLMLMAFAWRRGLHFYRYKLMLVAARRTGFVLKWSIVLAAFVLVLVVIPQLLAVVLDEPAPRIAGFLRSASDPWGIVASTAVALVFCPIQAVLVFHNESLRHALRDSVRFLRANAAVVVPFMLAVFLPFLLTSGAHSFLLFALGGDSIEFATSGIVLAAIEAVLAGWFIAAWVCLYKSRFSSRNEIQF